jgi:hypothetical protein
MRRTGVRRGITRRYNRTGEDFVPVTTRFTEAEYDTLHFAAATMRVSVSWLIFTMIRIWRKSPRRRTGNKFVTNYDFVSCYWGKNGGYVTEYLQIWPKFWKPAPRIRLLRP